MTVSVVRDFSIRPMEIWTYTALVLVSSLVVALVIGFPEPVVNLDCLLYTSPSPRDRG